MVGLACQYMWLVFVPLKDIITAFCLSVESSHPFKSLAIESPKMTVTLSYFFTCWVFQWRWIIGFADFFFVWFFSWFDRFRWFYIIPSITIVFNIIILWYFLASNGCSYILIICWVVFRVSLRFIWYFEVTLTRCQRLHCVFSVSSNVCMIQILVLFSLRN